MELPFANKDRPKPTRLTDMVLFLNHFKAPEKLHNFKTKILKFWNIVGKNYHLQSNVI